MGKKNVSQWGFQWGDFIDWSKLNYKLSPKGRPFIRHPSGMGTVFGMNDGMERNILVLDGKYRKLEGYSFYADNIDLNLPQCKNDGRLFINIRYNIQKTFAAGISDETIYALPECYSVANQDMYSSKINTDTLVSLGVGAQAANYCRSIKLEHNGITVGCDLPNINVLSRFYAEMVMIDEMDPTISIFSGEALCNWWIPYTGNYLSSSWYGDIFSSLVVDKYGCATCNKQCSLNNIVVPMLEI
ncbi:MAG: hypothetical protein Q4D29_12065 [Lachnospiraceae bacterium]|nr:hypothetical protein [Lachnospiraceae bacterium]